ncbi:globin domain-containing protein [Stratiformator vulcanicus]|uniref:Group 2 truncated hemoglobin GlbO n=1 Tax=Stratiformator vulcanicus TaxID=2527980 RepID=A0A517R4K6_9PLAN|nr:globin [Stratiformator vulcanicus]QDT38763.1 Group 2 truncated hemoglobin GlbO [Stratiformator vulcanicus]
MALQSTDDRPDPVFEIVPAIGAAPIEQLVAAFYRRVATDDLLRPMYPDEALDEAEQRLRDFLIFRCGGSEAYLTNRGHPRLRMRHAPFAIDQAARDRWVKLMDEAFEEVNIPDPQRSTLQEFLRATATFLRNRE